MAASLNVFDSDIGNVDTTLADVYCSILAEQALACRLCINRRVAVVCSPLVLFNPNNFLGTGKFLQAKKPEKAKKVRCTKYYMGEKKPKLLTLSDFFLEEIEGMRLWMGNSLCLWC